MADKKCPTRDQLSTYVRGLLPHEQADQVTAHVAACTNCEDTVEALSSQSDSLISRIQKPAAAQPYVDEAACHKVVESVQRQTPRPGVVKPAAAAEQRSISSPAEPARTMNRNEFVEFVTTTGFVSTDELATIEKQLSATDAADVQMLAKALVVTGTLTKFQASNIYQGKGKSLVFGEHVVVDRIGAGGMGQVYKAKHRRMDRIVALKVMSPAAMKNADSVRRFEREVRAAAKLSHPNIVHAYDAGVQDGVHFLVMEFVDGPDLSSLVKKQGKLPIKQACDYIAQAARGFAFAHSKGVVHRDIKPGNLLVDADGTVKVLDMGLARFDDGGVGGVMSEGELTQSGAVMGTVDYMAPEQAMNTRHADAKSDVYGLGCTLYRLLTGESVYGGQTMVEKILAHREKPIPALRQHRPEAPPALEALVTRMLAKEPAERPSMQEAAEALANIDAMPAITTSPTAAAPGKSGINLAAPPQTLPSPALQINPMGEGPGVRGIPVAPAIALPPQTGRLTPAAPGAKKTQAAAPPKKRSNTPILVAAGAGALLIALGVWFIFRDKEGNETARVQMPDGGTVETKIDPGATGVSRPVASPPVATASPTTTQVAANNPTKMFALPQTNTPTSATENPAVERAAAEKVLQLGGVISVVTAQKPTSSQVRSIAELPPGPFAVNTLDWNRTGAGDADLAVVAGLAKIVILRAPNLNLTDAGLAHVSRLTTLTELTLPGNRLTDAGLGYLSGLTNLKTLNLNGTQVTAAGVAALQAKLPGCTITVNQSPGSAPSQPVIASLPAAPSGTSPLDALKRESVSAEALRMAGFTDSAQVPSQIVALRVATQPNGLGAITAFTQSPDVKTLALGHDDGSVSVVDVVSGSVRTLPSKHPKKVQSLAFSPDGRRLASGSQDRLVFWDPIAGTELGTAPKLAGIPQWLEYMPDGRQLALGTHDNRIQLLAADTGDDVTKFREKLIAYDMAVSPDNRMIASAGPTGIRLGDSVSGEILQPLDEQKVMLGIVQFSRDGRLIASSSLGPDDPTIKVWDWQARKIMASLTQKPGRISSLAFDPTGRILAVADTTGRAELRQIDTGAELASWQLQKGTTHVAFDSTGRYLMVSNINGSAMILRLRDAVPATVAAVASTASSPPSDAVAFNGHYYKLVYDLHVTRNAAKAKCEQAGGYLACVTSQPELEFLMKLQSESTIPDVHKTMWLGGDSSSGQWKWISGEPWGFEPNSLTLAANFPYLKQFPEGRWSREADASNQVGGYFVEWNGAAPATVAMTTSVVSAPSPPTAVGGLPPANASAPPSATPTPLVEVLTGDKMTGVADGVVTFYGPQITGRRKGRGMVVNAPANWQTEGTAITCNFGNRNGSGVQFVHPYKNGHVRVHLMTEAEPALFNDGAFHITDPGKPHHETSTYPFNLVRRKFPLTERSYPMVSKLDASGRYELWCDFVLTITAQFDTAAPLQLKPTFSDEAAPAVLAPGQAAVITNGAGSGHNEARDVYLTTVRNAVLPPLPVVADPVPTETDPERRAIQWARARSAKLSLEGPLGGGVTLPSGGGLPNEPFVARIIDFREVASEYRRGIVDADMQYLAGLKNIGSLRLPFSQLTDAGMAPISTLTTLYNLDLSEARITDAGLQALGTLPKLRNLYLDGTNITDRGLALMPAQFPQLNETLKLDYTQVTDEGIQILGTMKHLRGLSLNGTRVTPAGIERLKAAKPNIGITWSPDAPPFVPSQFAGDTRSPQIGAAATPTKIATAPSPPTAVGGLSPVTAPVPVAPSPEKLAAAGFGPELSPPGELALIFGNESTKHKGEVDAAAFSPDGQQLVTAGTDKEIKFWDLTTGELRRSITTHQTAVVALAYSPDGQRLVAAAGKNGPVHVWGINKGTMSYVTPGASVVGLNFSADGSVYGGAGMLTARIWAADGKKLYEVSTGDKGDGNDRPGSVYSSAMHPDGKTLATGDFNGAVALWDMPTGRVTKTFFGHSHYVDSLAFSPDGRYLVSASRKNEKTANLWDVATGVSKKVGGGYTESVAFSRDSKWIATGDADGMVWLRSCDDPTQLRKIRVGSEGNVVGGLVFDPTGRYLAVAKNNHAPILLRVGDQATTPVAATIATAPSPPTAVGGLIPATVPATPVVPAARQKVPEAKDQAAPLAVIKDVFKDDYLAARVPDKKSPLASKLLQQAATVVDPIERFVLLNEARTLAADGDDPQVLRQVLEQLGQHFEVDPTQTLVDGWKAMLTKSRPAATVRTIYDDVSQRFDAAVTAADFDAAKKYADFANLTAPRLSDAAISKTARERLPALTARQTEYAAAKAAVEKLATAPDDAEANAVVGRYRATVENDWQNAFPLIAKGNDPLWKGLAEKSLAATDGPSRAAVGDAWWDAAQANAAQKPELTAAALYWYQSSVNTLAGLSKTRVDKRLTDGAALIPQRKIPPTPLAGDLATIRAGDTSLKGEVPKVFEFGGPSTPSTQSAPAAGGSFLNGATTARIIAERLLPLRSNFLIADAAGERQVNDVNALPAGSFDIVNLTANYADPLTDADLQVIATLPKLRYLRIQNSQMTGAGIVHLKSAPALEQLLINRCPLTDAGLQHVAGMTNLTSVDFSFTQVTDAGIVHLLGLKKLTAVNLIKTAVTDAGAARLQQALPNCKILR